MNQTKERGYDMASLRKMVGTYREELRDGIAEVIFWKDGRSWNAEAFWLDNDFKFEAEDMDRVEEILNTDPNAIIVNGYYTCPFTNSDEDGKPSDINFMMECIRKRYENGSCLLADFFAEHKTEEVQNLPEADVIQPVKTDPTVENKQRICKALIPVLQMTRNLYDLVDLDLDPVTELVTATFYSGHTKRANVAMDSGTSMIRDIIGQIT